AWRTRLQAPSAPPTRRVIMPLIEQTARFSLKKRAKLARSARIGYTPSDRRLPTQRPLRGSAPRRRPPGRSGQRAVLHRRRSMRGTPMRHLTPERLTDIESALRQSPDGLTSTELAVRLGVDASTVRRDLTQLRSTQPGLRRRGRRYHLDFHQASRPLMLTPDEALPLYLACRLLARSQSERNPHAETVMLKLADTLHEDAPPFAHAIEDAARLLRALPERVGYRAILETVTQGWARGRKVALRYRNLANEVHDRRIHPYCIEPYGETNACYTIAFDERSGQVRTFRLDRALTATLTEEPFAT